MADLDNFFAKKDKKKSKKKFTTSEELAKKLDEKPTASTVLAKKKERPLEQPEGGVEVQVEDEWKEIEEDQGRDYTGLKIQQLTINEDDQMQANLGYDADGEPTGDGETNSGNAKGQDPWKKSGGSAPVGKPAPVVVDTTPQVYVSPIVKNAATRLRKGMAPDLANEDYFPSLGAEKPAAPLKKGAQFEEIKHGARPQKQTQGNAPVSVANRFTSLSDGTFS